jgi:hypothetical protein
MSPILSWSFQLPVGCLQFETPTDSKVIKRHTKITVNQKKVPESGRHDDRPDNGGSKHLWNVGKVLPDYMTQHPWRQQSSYPSREPEVSQMCTCFGLYSLTRNCLIGQRRDGQTNCSQLLYSVNLSFPASLCSSFPFSTIPVYYR